MAPSDGLQRSFQVLKDAVQEYNTEAVSKDWDLIHEKGVKFIEVREEADKLNEERIRRFKCMNPVLRKANSGVERLCKSLNYYSQTLDVIAQAAPPYVQLAWGTVRFLLTVSINSSELKDTVHHKLADIGEQFKQLTIYLNLYPTPAMIRLVSEAYENFTIFLTKVVKYYKQNALSMWPISIAYVD
jgi:hypothetical protein